MTVVVNIYYVLSPIVVVNRSSFDGCRVSEVADREKDEGKGTDVEKVGV
jgi:hypothetical protein